LAPNFNGLAESAVRIWKKAFQNRFRKQTLRLDEFLTATALAEDIINGRPLDYADGKLYTPNHLILRGPPQEALPIIDPDHIRTIAMHYQLVEEVTQNIWEDFHPGWLYQTQRLPKWQAFRKNIQPGTLVVMFNEDKFKSTRNQWDVGRIVSVKYGNDGQARKAIVAVERPQNTKKQYDLVTHLRSVSKLVPIDLIAEQVATILPMDISKYPLADWEGDEITDEEATKLTLEGEEVMNETIGKDAGKDTAQDNVGKTVDNNGDVADKAVEQQHSQGSHGPPASNLRSQSNKKSMTSLRVSDTDHHGE
jgi:hypothetical protein